MSNAKRLQTVIGATSMAAESLIYAEEALCEVEQARTNADLNNAFTLLSMWAQRLKEAADAGYRLSHQFPDSIDEVAES